jgi:hypothetical protein
MRVIRLLFILVLVGSLNAQRERQVPPPSQDNSDFGTKFFDQLQRIFGKFRDSDLQRVFQIADSIQCSELVSGKGEWRPVAFFNEKRELGDWYRRNIEEVRGDLSVYAFKGVCRGDRGTIQLTTKFPVGDSLDLYERGRIPLSEVDINVNAPVDVKFDTRSGAYTFDLPYLFELRREGTTGVYSLNPQHLGDRYVTDVTNPWECKAVSSTDITYRFLICRTSTADRSSKTSSRGAPQAPPGFGSHAYFILSDGTEAKSTVTLRLDDSDTPPAPDVPASAPEPQAKDGWQAPVYSLPIVDAGNKEFRIRFNPQVWTDRIASPQVLFTQGIKGLQTAKPPEGADYCVWTPGASDMLRRLLTDEPDKDVSFSVLGKDKTSGLSGPTTVSINFEMKALTGNRIGALQCFFPRIDSASNVAYDRWSAIVGSQLKLEVRP